MRIVYARLQLFGPNDGATDLLESSYDRFAFEPVVTGTLPGLRVADGHHALIQIVGEVSVTDPNDATAPLALPNEAGSIGVITASTAADDGTPGGAPTGADLKGQLYIDAGGPLGPVFDIPAGAGGQILTSHLGSIGAGYRIGSTPGGAIGGSYLVTQGSGYNVGDVCAVSGGDGNAQATINYIGPSGLLFYSITNPGTGYAAGVTYSLTGGSGSGASIFVDEVTAPSDETYTIVGGDLDARIKITNVDSSGAILAYSLVSGGTGYAAGATYFLSGSGPGAGAALVVDTVTLSGGSGASGVFFSGAQLGNVAGRVLALKITQVGSATPGRNLTVKITF